MVHIRTGISRTLSIGAALILFTFTAGAIVPVRAYADESACSPVAAAPNGVQSPTGSDAETYTYNECTGLYENPYYTWNPGTRETSAKYSYVYTYNAGTGKWDAQKWTYSPANSNWHQSPFSVSSPPAGSQTIGGPAPVETAPATSTNAPNNNNQSSSETTNNATTDSTNNSGLNNNVSSSAATGNVIQLGNTTTGNATSGNATALANVMNLLQSSSSMGANVATFVTNIDGDVQGDFIIDPNALQPALASNTLSGTNNIDINIANNGEITNNIALTADTGDVTSSKNTTAGNATSGNAQAIANVVNMMNSMIASSQSFLGVVNINGNFQGDILVPENFLDTLLASNAPHETVNVSQNTINNVTANIANNQSIANNITTAATSGDVTMEKNTIGGNATSGSATTNVTIFDLTGSQVAAGNAMLVFVNVMGTWVGLLMDAPAGSTAVALGGGVTNASMNNTVNADVTNNGKITNNIDVAAASGNVASSKNTTAGNATSGNANAAVNVANITNSSFGLTNWFGILFINVFGNWNGNFGVMKPAIAGAETGGKGADAPGSGGSSGSVFGFVPSDVSGWFGSSKNARMSSSYVGGASAVTGVSLVADPASAVLGGSTQNNKITTTTPDQEQNKNASDNSSFGLMALGASIFALGMFLVRRNQNG